MIAEIRAAQPEAGPRVRQRRSVQPIVPDVFVRPAPDGGLAVELNSDTLPKVLVNQSYYAEVAGSAQGDKDKAYLADCLQSANWLDARARSARQDHPQGRDRDRAPAGRLLRPRRPASAAAEPQDRRRRDRHARVDRLARHRQQIHGDQPRHFRTEVFLHLGDRGRRRRRGAFGRGGAPSDQAADRGRERAAMCCPTTRSSRSCARPASTSRAARSRSTARRCAFRRRCSDGARRADIADRRAPC